MNMDDRFMYGLRETPSRKFAQRLSERLKQQERGEMESESERRPSRWAMIAAASVLAVALFALPSVRASGQAFLNLFRVVNFTAVPVNVDRINQLNRSGLNLSTLIGKQVEVLTDPGPPRVFATPADAADAAGIKVRLPAILPPGLTVVRTEVEGEHAVRVTGDTRMLMDILEATGITDVRPPAELDGQVATLRVPPIMRIVYASGNLEVAFLQARSPEVTLPATVDISALGEIGLRIAGLGRSEAHTLAQAIDWRNTLVLPVPAGVSSFRQVGVHGSHGLLVTFKEKREIRSIVWSEGGSVYGITGPLGEGLIAQMADSVQ
jgi:hypothetical protein